MAEGRSKLYSALVFSSILIVTILASAYAGSFGRNEIVHFWVAFPLSNVREPVRVELQLGPNFVVEPVVVDIAKRGVLKKLLNPQVEALSTHWIYNVGDRPRRIRLNLVNVTLRVEWKVHSSNPWDPRAKEFLEPIAPGRKIAYLGIDWIFYFPLGYESMPVLYDGGLEIRDADSGELLTFVPIKIINSAARGEG